MRSEDAKRFYVYKFLNNNNEVIYVGITGCLKGRIRSQHFTSHGHLPNECYEETEVVVYSECITSDDVKIKERYLINRLSPKYNVKMNNGSQFGFEIDDFNWKYIAIDKTRIDRKSRLGDLLSPFKKHDHYSYYQDFYRKCVKDKIGSFWYLVCIPSGRWSVVWAACLNDPGYLDDIISGDFFDRSNNTFGSSEEALIDFISKIENQVSQHAKIDGGSSEDQGQILNMEALNIARNILSCYS